MTLSWAATVAGNLTLVGSIANLIVAEKAHHEVRPEQVQEKYKRPHANAAYHNAQAIPVSTRRMPMSTFVSLTAENMIK
jgi:hypothetical protein